MMLFEWFKRRAARRKSAGKLYQAALRQSREPVFYTVYGVADSWDGRFDVMSAHIAILTLALNEAEPKEGAKLGQALFDAMFSRMALDLREAGVGDVGLSKHMQKMMKAFNGRIHGYHDALKQNGIEALELMVARNVYRVSGESIPDGVAEMAAYLRECHRVLKSYTMTAFEKGEITFPAPLTVSQAPQTERQALHA